MSQVQTWRGNFLSGCKISGVRESDFSVRLHQPAMWSSVARLKGRVAAACCFWDFPGNLTPCSAECLSIQAMVIVETVDSRSEAFRMKPFCRTGRAVIGSVAAFGGRAFSLLPNLI